MSNNEENNEKIEITFDDNNDIIYDYIEDNKKIKQENNNFKKCNFLLKIYIFFLFLLIIILIILLLILYL